MRIRYNKTTGRRLWGALEWSAAAGRVREVEEAGLVTALLLQPGDQFCVDASEPMLTIPGVTSDTAGNLALAGVGSMGQLARLSGPEIRRVAKELRADRRAVAAWVRAAVAWCKQESESGSESTGQPPEGGARG